jgi:hypothetical protein
MTDEDIAAAEAHFNLWYPDTAWGFDPLCELIAQTRQAARAEAADTLKAQAAEIERLREALHEVFEQWAGSEGFIPKTAPEGYLLGLTKRMADTARAALGETE